MQPVDRGVEKNDERPVAERVARAHTRTMAAGANARLVPVLVVLGASACTDEMPLGVEEQGIVGGVSTGPDDYPATGMLMRGRHYRCTATLIAPDVAITAAHCLNETGFGEFAFSL